MMIRPALLSFLATTLAMSAPIADKVEPATIPVPLSQVRLLDGPFLDSLKANSAYLPKLEPDRLLHNFRKNAGLEPKGEIYGGWENHSIAGHTLGHYLTACALTYAQTGDEAFKKRVDDIVDELLVCQTAEGDGYVAGYYGYLWSKVYGDDMFSVFEDEGVLNPVVGMRYRESILARGGTRDGMDLLRGFLGRDPSPDAFLEKIGLGGGR